MSKTVWILNHYAGNMFIVGGGRHYYFSKYLKSYGYNPVVFCSNYDHFLKKNCVETDSLWVEKKEPETKVSYVFIKTRGYSNNGTQRFLNMVDFYRGVLKAAKQYAAGEGAPDIVYASSVHPLTLVAGIKLAKLFGVKCICEVRDLWPESIVAYLEGFKRNNPLIQLLYLGEKRIYKKADSLIFTVEGGYDYITEKGWTQSVPKDKVFYINNGVDLEQFYFNRDEYRIVDSDLENQSYFKVVYTGSIRKVNNIGKLLDVAKMIKERNIIFLIWGDGDELPKLKERVKSEGITNVTFKGRVDKRYIPYITSRADLNLAHNDESPLFRYGISFNKIFDYFAAGKPIMCDFYSKYNPVVLWGAGEGITTSDASNIAEEIKKYATMDREELEKYSIAALNAANYYDFKNLTKKLIKIIEKM